MKTIKDLNNYLNEHPKLKKGLTIAGGVTIVTLELAEARLALSGLGWVTAYSRGDVMIRDKELPVAWNGIFYTMTPKLPGVTLDTGELELTFDLIPHRVIEEQNKKGRYLVYHSKHHGEYKYNPDKVLARWYRSE